MAHAYKCDRCGTYYSKLEEANNVEVMGKWDPVYDCYKYDICNKCREDFMVFMGVQNKITSELNEEEVIDLALDYGTSVDVSMVEDEITDTGNKIVCKTCMGRGLVPIGPEVRGVMKCKVCGGSGRLTRK